MASGGYCQVTGKYYPSLDSHHSIPVEFGGENSQRVLLGPDVHQTIHRSVRNSKVRDEFLSSLTPKGRKLASMLIRLIQEAELKSHTQLKDTVSVKLDIPQDLYVRIKTIQQEMGYGSVPKTILYILEKVVRR